MLTIREAFTLPCCKELKIVAGKLGLDQTVRRVHTADSPDADYNWLPETLLLTVGYGLMDAPDRQAALIPTLVENGVVGMIFAVGRYFDTVPQPILDAAEAHQFPLIISPPEIQFIMIAEQLYIEIINREFALKERASDIRRQLMRLVLEGKDLQAVVTTLTKILRRSIIIDDSEHKLLAHAQYGSVDEARQQTIERGASSPQSINIMHERGVYDEWQRDLRPSRLLAQPDLGLTMERIVAPIIVGGERFGTIWIVAGDYPLTDLDELTIGHAATVAAVIMLKEQAVQEAQRAVRGDFLAELLYPDVQLSTQAMEKGKRVGYRVDQSHQLLFVTRAQYDEKPLTQLATHLSEWLRKQAVWGLVAPRDRGIVMIVESRSKEMGQRLATTLVETHELLDNLLIVGVSDCHQGKQPLYPFYTQAMQAVDIRRRLENKPGVVCFWELGLLNWLYVLPSDVLASNYYLAHIKALAQYDQAYQGELLLSLEIYLEYGGALQEAAAALHIHRNTLAYRMKRLQELLEIDLKANQNRFDLYVALKAYRLRVSTELKSR